MTLRLNGTSSGFTEIDAPAAAGSNKITLPTSNGSAEQFLKNSGTAGELEFASLASSDMPTGSILQVVQAGTSTEVVVSTQTYTDTGLSGSITPTSTSSKILVIIDQQIYFNRGVANHGGGLRVLRDSTVIHSPVANSTGPYEFYFTDLTGFYTRAVINKLDSPATTSSVTYKTQGRPYEISSSGKATFQQAGTSTAGTSYITLIEVAA